MILFHFFVIIYFTDASYLYFDRNSYDIFISESTPIYTKISVIQAVSSPSLSIQYELHGDINKTFYLNSLTGELILLNSVDYETLTIYKLTIEASSSSLIAPCFSELIIHILNVNDNPPEINLILYSSILYESNIIKYDLNTYSTPFATINIKDPDESSTNLSLSLNDTEHFQVQLVRQIQNGFTTEAIYILSTKNNSQLIYQDYYYLLLNSCDNDEPLLCSNQSYRFQIKSNEYLCNLSFNQDNYMIDIKESLPNGSLLMHKITNKYCEKIIYSIDDVNNFFIDAQTGDLFTLRRFNRKEQSIYIIHLFVNNIFKIKITIRILDENGNLPFLIKKKLTLNRNQYFNIHLFNSTLCRPQLIITNYFRLLPNCTILPLVIPPKGEYLFNIELIQRINYHDTFLLELTEGHVSKIIQSKWIITIPVILGVLCVFVTIIITMIIIKQRRDNFDQKFHDKQKASSLSTNDNNEEYKSGYNKYEAVSTNSKLKVHDDHEFSSSPTSTAIYLIQKPSPPLPSLSPPRDDEGYSGSSDVSEHQLPFESTIISANELLEQYRIHTLQNDPSMLPLYDVPRRYTDRMNAHCISPNVSLV